MRKIVDPLRVWNALRLLKRWGAARRLERCCDPHYCKLRLCARCDRRWFVQAADEIARTVASFDASRTLTMVIGCAAAMARDAVEMFRRVRRRFFARARALGVRMIGVIHLSHERSLAGSPVRWFAHAHFVVELPHAQIDASMLQRMWERAGGSKVAHVEEPEDLVRLRSYSLAGALDPPDDDDSVLRAWIAATFRMHFVIGCGVGRTDQRDTATSTPVHVDHETERSPRIEAMILDKLAQQPRSESRLIGSFRSCQRSDARSLLKSLHERGLVRGEALAHGTRWFLRQPHDGCRENLKAQVNLAVCRKLGETAGR